MLIFELPNTSEFFSTTSKNRLENNGLRQFRLRRVAFCKKVSTYQTIIFIKKLLFSVFKKNCVNKYLKTYKKNLAIWGLEAVSSGFQSALLKHFLKM